MAGRPWVYFWFVSAAMQCKFGPPDDSGADGQTVELG